MRLAVAGLMAGLCLAAPAAAFQPPIGPAPPAVILVSEQFTIRSKITGADYLIQVARPLAPLRPGEKAAAVYVLDGTYLYDFSHVPQARRAASKGAAHGAEIPYVLDNWTLIAPTLKLSDEEQAVTRLAHSCWLSFARTGRPQCDGAPDWPAYTAKNDVVMELSATPAVRRDLHKARLDAQEAAMDANLALQRAEIDRLVAAAP